MLVTHTPPPMRDKYVTSRFVKKHLVCSSNFPEKTGLETYIFYVGNTTFGPVRKIVLFRICSKNSFSTFADAWHAMTHFWSCHAGGFFSISCFLFDYRLAILIHVYFCDVWYPKVISEKDRVRNLHAAKRNHRFTGARGCVTNLRISQNSEICHASPCASKSTISLSCVEILDSVFFWDYIWVSYNTEIKINQYGEAKIE